MTRRWQRQRRALRASRPGERCQDRYRAARRGDDGRLGVGRIVRLGLAGGALAPGGVFVILPGPAVVFFFVAGALLARRGAGRLRWCRSRLSRPGRLAVSSAPVLAGAAGGRVSYRLLFH